jgi:hypothetical protein
MRKAGYERRPNRDDRRRRHSRTTTSSCKPCRSPRRAPRAARRQGGRVAGAAAGTEKASSNAPFWITLASTALFTGGAITFGVLAHNADQKLDDELNKFPANPNSIEDARSTLKQDALLTDIMTGAAVVSGAFCVYFAVSGSHSSASASQSANLRIAPTANGVRVLGNF